MARSLLGVRLRCKGRRRACRPLRVADGEAVALSRPWRRVVSGALAQKSLSACIEEGRRVRFAGRLRRRRDGRSTPVILGVFAPAHAGTREVRTKETPVREVVRGADDASGVVALARSRRCRRAPSRPDEYGAGGGPCRLGGVLARGHGVDDARRALVEVVGHEPAPRHLVGGQARGGAPRDRTHEDGGDGGDRRRDGGGRRIEEDASPSHRDGTPSPLVSAAQNTGAFMGSGRSRLKSAPVTASARAGRGRGGQRREGTVEAPGEARPAEASRRKVSQATGTAEMAATKARQRERCAALRRVAHRGTFRPGPRPWPPAAAVAETRTWSSPAIGR